TTLVMADSASEMQGYISDSDEARRHFDETFKAVEALATEQGKVTWAKLAGLTAEFRKHDDRIRSLMLGGDATGAERISNTEARA
ncbi:hypothetical protein, partial [Stenotrophomonas sp. GbtcB23]|uniref:hypothetical protein n=1 Tax=Stenotrophomonas sp. GbtcB23 TaxID=2824768 RepID=UPI001C305DF7